MPKMMRSLRSIFECKDRDSFCARKSFYRDNRILPTFAMTQLVFLNALLVISTLLYLALLLFAHSGWRRLTASKKSDSADPVPGISVVIPFRNEAHNLSRIFEDINHQQTSGDNEVIWVDDHSEDGSAEIIEQLIAGNTNHQLYKLNDQMGKKSALKLAIEKSQFNWILTTDADVRIDPKWLNTVLKALAIHDCDMLVLPVGVEFEKKNWLATFLAAEHTAVQALSIGLAARNFPISCNGANLLFRKSAFDKVSGYKGNDHIPSGDDVFLLQSFLSNKLNVKAHWHHYVLVRTKTPFKFIQALEQRLRWAGKTGRMSHPYARIAGAILVFNAVMLIIAPFWSSTTLELWFGALLLRLITDVLLIKSVGKHYNQHWNPLTLTLVSLLYIPYILLMGLGSAIWRPKWKGRKT